MTEVCDQVPEWASQAADYFAAMADIRWTRVDRSERVVLTADSTRGCTERRPLARRGWARGWDTRRDKRPVDPRRSKLRCWPCHGYFDAAEWKLSPDWHGSVFGIRENGSYTLRLRHNACGETDRFTEERAAEAGIHGGHPVYEGPV